jgi:hypothetical protein
MGKILRMCVQMGIGALLSGIFLAGSAAEAGKTTMGVPEFKEITPQVMATGPALLFSDSPERVFKTGILYQDTVQGPNRVFFHHVNGTKADLKLAIILRAESAEPTTVTLGTKGVGGPSADFFKAAKDSQKEYFTDQEPVQKVLKFKRSLELLTGTSGADAGITMNPQQLLTGMLDFSASAPVTVTVLVCKPEDKAAKFSATAPILPMDEHPLRGTYKHGDLLFTLPEVIDLDQSPVYGFKMASDDDPYFLQGTDSTTGRKTENNGNYGVVYKINYKVKSSAGYALAFNPAGGLFAGIGVDKTGSEKKLVWLPEGVDSAIGKTGDEVYTFAEHAGGSEIISGSFIWSPPGAACLPIRLLWQSKKS